MGVFIGIRLLFANLKSKLFLLRYKTMNLKKLILLFLMLYAPIGLFSQEKNFITGKLVDEATREPVVFATVRLKGKSVGVISNADGSFVVPNEYLALGDVLEISCLGYRTLEVKLSDLNVDQVNIILVKEEVFNLEGTVVVGKRPKRYGAQEIVKKAIENIPENYPNAPFSLVGYYRDYQVDEGIYVNLNEAILEVYDPGFSIMDKSATKVQMYDERINKTFKVDTLARQSYDYRTGQKTIEKAFLKPYGGNEFTILRVHDAIRNYLVDSYDFVNVLQTDFIPHHNFSKMDPINFDGEPLYVIEFKRNRQDNLATGKLYVSQFDFSIYKMEYALFNKNVTRETEKKGNQFMGNQLIFEVVLEYRKKDDQMYLNYISFHNTFELRLPPAFIVEDVVMDINRKCLVVNFNTEPETKSALEQRSYNLRYKGKRLSFRLMEKEGNSVLLYPRMDEDELKDMVTTLKEMDTRRGPLNKLLEIEVKDVRNLEGELINAVHTKDYEQYREFFVQNINKGKMAPLNGEFMPDDKPIFSSKAVSGEKETIFWMNPPLIRN